jgi:hypothetical protein
MIDPNESIQKDVETIICVQFRKALNEFYDAHIQTATIPEREPKLKLRAAQALPERAAIMASDAANRAYIGGRATKNRRVPPRVFRDVGRIHRTMATDAPAKQPALGIPAL